MAGNSPNIDLFANYQKLQFNYLKVIYETI